MNKQGQKSYEFRSFSCMNANICQLFVYDLSSAALCLLFLNLEQLCSLGTRSIWLQELKFFIRLMPINKNSFFSDTLFLQTFGLIYWPLNSANLSLSSVVTLEWICKNKRAAASAMLHAGKINVFLFYCSVSWLMKFWQRKYFLLEKCTAGPESCTA